MTPSGSPSTTSSPARRIACLRRLLGGAVLGAVAFAGVCGNALGAPDPDLRLVEIGAIAEHDAARARTILVQEGPRLIAGAPYRARIHYLRLLRRAHADTGNLRDVHDTNEQIIALAEAEGDTLNFALASLGRAQSLITGSDPAAALGQLETLGARYRHLDSPEFDAGLEALHGSAYNAVGQYDRALRHFMRALDIVLQHPAIWTPRAADIRLAMARMYVNLGDPARALDALRAIRSSGKPMAPRLDAAVSLFEGRALVAQGKLDAALDVYTPALALARRHALPVSEGGLLGDIAAAHLKAGRHAQAEAAARAALAPARQGNDQLSLQMATAYLGLALYGQGREREGLHDIDTVLADLRAAGAKAAVGRLLADKSRALERRGHFQEALATLRERETVMEQLALNERNKAISALQEQFKARERAAQIESLSRDNEIKDAEIRHRGLIQTVASLGAALALFLCAGVLWLYRKSVRTSRRLAEANDELAYRSTHDPLTGLFNRRSFHDRMRSRTGEAVARIDAAECFTLLDIDHFKRINDEYGHAAGDAVLVEVGQRLRQAVRESDMVLRWGGEEFLVYSQGVSPTQRPLLVQRILDAISSTPVLLDDGTALRISATAGAVSLPFQYDGEDKVDWEQAIALADRALYKGKENGRNRGYLVAGPPRPDSVAHEGLQLHLILPGVAA